MDLEKRKKERRSKASANKFYAYCSIVLGVLYIGFMQEHYPLLGFVLVFFGINMMLSAKSESSAIAELEDQAKTSFGDGLRANDSEDKLTLRPLKKEEKIKKER